MNGHTGGTAAAHTHTRSCRPPLYVWVRAMRARTCAVLRAACCVLRLACTSFTQVHCRHRRTRAILVGSEQKPTEPRVSRSLRRCDAIVSPAFPRVSTAALLRPCPICIAIAIAIGAP